VQLLQMLQPLVLPADYACDSGDVLVDSGDDCIITGDDDGSYD
jgi:hypothetical protein